ncbi:MAG: chemotaxis protein CheD [Candidatus Omnitrophota bacterium]|nr:chemotaxis protein CheD [Candidatus Omnitrophota bacterium]
MEDKTIETASAIKIIEVEMADMQVCESPGRLITRGLGSCLGITIYDNIRKAGCIIHAMLPDISRAKIRTNPGRFVNSSITHMIEKLEKLGCQRSRMVAKLFGGAHMFSFITESTINVGQNNIDMAESLFKELGMKVIAREVGGTFGRTIELNLENGKVLVKTASWGQKEV